MIGIALGCGASLAIASFTIYTAVRVWQRKADSSVGESFLRSCLRMPFKWQIPETLGGTRVKMNPKGGNGAPSSIGTPPMDLGQGPPSQDSGPATDSARRGQGTVLSSERCFPYANTLMLHTKHLDWQHIDPLNKAIWT
jgi:hypothetical protein